MTRAFSSVWPLAQHLLLHSEACAAQCLDRKSHVERIGEPGRQLVVDLDPADDEYDPVDSLEFRDRMADRGEPFGTGALQEAQVVRIVDDAPCVGVLVVDTDRQREGGLEQRAGVGSR